MIGRVGSGNITTERITLDSTVKQIFIFSFMLVAAGIAELFMAAFVAVMVGRPAWAVFLLGAVLLDIRIGTIHAANPAQIGLYAQKRYSIADPMPPHVARARIILLLFGAALLAVELIGKTPVLWHWHLDYEYGRYMILSQFLAYRMHEASGLEILGRALAIFSTVFVGYPAAEIVGWASRMELTRSSFRETATAKLSPETVVGPFGEQYKESGHGRENGTDVVVVEPQSDYGAEPMQVE